MPLRHIKVEYRPYKRPYTYINIHRETKGRCHQRQATARRLSRTSAMACCYNGITALESASPRRRCSDDGGADDLRPPSPPPPPPRLRLRRSRSASVSVCQRPRRAERSALCRASARAAASTRATQFVSRRRTVGGMASRHETKQKTEQNSAIPKKTATTEPSGTEQNSATLKVHARPLARSLARSLARPLARPLARSPARSPARSLARSPARSPARPFARSLARLQTGQPRCSLKRRRHEDSRETWRHGSRTTASPWVGSFVFLFGLFGGTSQGDLALLWFVRGDKPKRSANDETDTSHTPRCTRKRNRDDGKRA